MRFGPAFVSVLSSLSALTSVVAGRGRPLRQHVEPRALLDVCVNLDADILAKSGIIIPLDLLGALDICLCLSALPLALTTDIRLKLLALIPGNSELLAILTALINTSPGSKHCTYPPHSTPLCKADDPCGFHCDAPYVPKNGQCVCEAPYSICNDQCGSFPKGCGSAVPHSRRKHLTARSSGVFTYSDALATCKNEEQVCGVTHGATGFECLNTDQTLDSCGGCVFPNPFLLDSEQGPVGQDCTRLPHVLDVQCASGRCLVKRCQSGFKITSGGDACEADTLSDAPALTVQHGRRKHSIPSRSRRTHGRARDEEDETKRSLDIVSQPGNTLYLTAIVNALVNSDLLTTGGTRVDVGSLVSSLLGASGDSPLDLSTIVKALVTLNLLDKTCDTPALNALVDALLGSGQGNLLDLGAIVKALADSDLLGTGGSHLSVDDIVASLLAPNAARPVDLHAIVVALISSNILAKGGQSLDVDAVVKSILADNDSAHLDLDAIVKTLLKINLLPKQLDPVSVDALVTALLRSGGRDPLGLTTIVNALSGSGLTDLSGNLLDVNAILTSLSSSSGNGAGSGQPLNLNAIVKALVGSHTDIAVIVKSITASTGGQSLDLDAVVKAVVVVALSGKKYRPSDISTLVNSLLNVGTSSDPLYLGTIVHALGDGGLLGTGGTTLSIGDILNALLKSDGNILDLNALVTALLNGKLLTNSSTLLNVTAIVDSLLRLNSSTPLDLSSVLKGLVTLGLLGNDIDLNALIKALLTVGGGNALDLSAILNAILTSGILSKDGSVLTVNALVNALVTSGGSDSTAPRGPVSLHLRQAVDGIVDDLLGPDLLKVDVIADVLATIGLRQAETSA